MLNNNLNNGGTMCFAKVGLIAGTTTTYTTTVATDFIIGGKFGVQFATKTNQATPTTDARTGLAFPTLSDDQACALVFGVNAAGAIQLLQGDLKTIEPGTTDFLITPPFPSVPEDFCPIGYALVKNDSGSDFIAGTTAWAGVDMTFVNVSMLPDRPQES